MNKTINNLEELNKFAENLAKVIKNEEVFSLIGDLGAGKTTLVQYIGKAMGVDDYITSPTFSIVNIYNGDTTIYHLDLYRLETPEELDAFDYETYFYPKGVTFIEWASKGDYYIPEDIIEIKIEIEGNKRIIEVLEKDKKSKELCKNLMKLEFGDEDENFSN